MFKLKLTEERTVEIAAESAALAVGKVTRDGAPYMDAPRLVSVEVLCEVRTTRTERALDDTERAAVAVQLGARGAPVEVKAP